MRPAALLTARIYHFASNTNWQGYGGETTMSYLTQMLGLTVQNFVSAAAGMATLAAFIRGLASRRGGTQTIGNFWVDLVRTTLYILLPLAVMLALSQASQGVIQNFSAYQRAPLLQPTVDANGNAITEQSWLAARRNIWAKKSKLMK